MMFLLQAATPPFVGSGEAAALAGALVWGVATVIYAHSFRRGDPLDAVWFKNSIAAIVLVLAACILGPRWGGGWPGEGETSWILISGLLGLCVGDFLYFLALSKIGVGRTVILSQLTPAVTALGAWPLYGQQLSGQQWVGLWLVVVGGILAESRLLKGSRPKHESGGVLAALGCVLAWTLGNLTIHHGLAETGAVTGGALRLVAGAGGFAIWFLFRGQLWRRLQLLKAPDAWRAYGFATILGTVVGMSLYVAAFKWSKQGVAASLSASVPLFAIPLSVWLFGERPGWRGWSGAALVMIGVAAVSLVSA
jgi:drug/metabolite transporter (DMT)-like permease